MFTEKPEIGVTGPDRGGLGAWIFTALSIRLAGGKPKRITPSKKLTINEIDGLILGGGADVSPDRYGEDQIKKEDFKKGGRSFLEWVLTILLFPVYIISRYILSTKTSPVDPERDELEFELLDGAVKQNKPVLGICRGMQLINIYFKGSLHQDIRNFYSETPQVASVFPKKKIAVKSGSQLEKILGTIHCHVNALHNQAIKVAGQGIRPVAREIHTDIIQAIEHDSLPNLIGVQWHPEYLIQIKQQRSIFRFMIDESTKSRKIPT
ncbi:MAG: gamma-glutamyl-gamma-aminobutyrate hydrolase family protein [Balneolaceae bacterium]